MTFLAPKRYVASVDCIDLDELYRSGKRALLVDRDNTLVPRDASCAPPEARDWLDRARRLGFRVCLVSNNWYRSQVGKLPRAWYRPCYLVRYEASAAALMGGAA